MTDASNDRAAAKGGEAVWEEALAQVRAATAIAADPLAPPQTAAPHLRAAWTALAELADAPANEATIPWLPEPPDDVRQRTAPWLPGADAPPRIEDSAALRLCLADVHTALRQAERSVFGGRLRRRARRRLVLTLVAIAAVVIPAALLVWQTAPPTSEGPWVVHYFASPDLSGEPVVRHEGNVVQDWDVDAPWEGGPADGFSSRWQTCLELPSERDVSFILASDDGSRLFVDEALVIDNWGRHRHRSRGNTIRLGPGVHELRVEHFDHLGEASLTLHASVDGGRPKPLPVRMLRRPSDNGC